VRAAGESHRLAIAQQFSPANVQPEATEADLLTIHRIRQNSRETASVSSRPDPSPNIMTQR
jgi:hypothetical protein